MTEVKTTCPYCGVGCGVRAKAGHDGAVTVTGDPSHPANFGKLCSKGLALGDTTGLGNRLLYPEINGRRAGWDEAISVVADKFKAAIAEHGPDSVAFYVSGQFLTEDYYIANKLMKGFIGSANIDTNSRLCMASAVAGHKRAFGADVVPCAYEDLEEADLVVLVGSNLAWCHPILHQRLQAAREKRGMKLVVIDPRRSATAEAADLHLAIKPQADVALFNGLFRYLYSAGKTDWSFVTRHTENVSSALMATNDWHLEQTAAACRLSVEELTEFYELFARYEKTVTAFSMGVNQSVSGTDKVNAIINCHLLTGRISKPGAGPFSLTGQPNAMGGREVGGLANMLAAHMEIENPDHRHAVKQFWKSPHIPTKAGLKAVEMFNAVRDGRIKALWIMATNPAVSMPDSGAVAGALKTCPTVIVSDVTAQTETAQYAHILLPALGWGEKDGTVTNSERRISRQRAFLNRPGEARADWQIMCDFATAMGFSGFSYSSAADIFAEHVALTQLNNGGSRKLDLAEWQEKSFDNLAPMQWGGPRPFADLKFQTPSGKARFVATHYVAQALSKYVLNTGRIRDQWHTMTRTGLVPRLFSHRAEPYIELHPSDAADVGIAAAELVKIKAGKGHSIARALITKAIQPGTVFIPMHWSGAFAKASLVNANVASNVDPVSGQPSLKSGDVDIARLEAAWHGYGVSSDDCAFQADYLAKCPLEGGGISFECAGLAVPEDWPGFLGHSLKGGDVTIVSSKDSAAFRCAVLHDGKLAFAFFASARPIEASRAWLKIQLHKEVNPLLVLAGRPASAEADQGAILCACNAVGVNRIASFISSHPGASLDDVCRTTKAGTGCGTCRIEIRKMIHEAATRIKAAE